MTDRFNNVSTPLGEILSTNYLQGVILMQYKILYCTLSQVEADKMGDVCLLLTI